MEKITLTVPDSRMLQLIDLLKGSGRIQYKQEFYDAAGIHKQNIKRIREGLQHFTAVQISAICEAYSINANWIHGLTDTMFNSTSNKNSNKKIFAERILHAKT